MPLLIFDFDGVVADSEVLANAELAQAVTELGLPTTLADSYRLYMGKRFSDVLVAVEAAIGRPVPPEFAQSLQARTLARLAADLTPVSGVAAFLDRFDPVPRCIASSSAPERLAVCLDRLELADRFGTHVYSATMVPRGKPHPDLFQFAARHMGFAADAAIVIEDSVNGILAARAAGMRAVGLLAGGHVCHDTAAQLSNAGAHYVARTYDDLANYLDPLISPV